MKTYKPLVWLTLFSIAMGYLETAVVIYLRKIYYPNGFQFPLAPIEPSVAITEFWREAATLVMLVGIAVLTGKNRLQRFAFFLYCFAIWDLFYYIFLKILLNWPESVLTWDVLFLIPLPWLGPVLAPCIVSFTFIVFTLLVLLIQAKSPDAGLQRSEQVLMLVGALIIITSFIYSYVTGVNTSNPAAVSLFEDIKNYIPKSYNWFLFALGEVMIFAAIAGFIKRYVSTKTTDTKMIHYGST